MILISKFLSSFCVVMLFATQVADTSYALQPVVVLYEHKDQIVASKGDEFQMTTKGGQVGGKLEVLLVDGEGRATEFRLSGVNYYWKNGRYWGRGQFHSYRLEKLSSDVYNYEKRDGNDRLMESGSVVWTR
jgi:hypothetical protein